MATQIGNPIVSPTTRSRLAHLMGFPPSPMKTPQEDDWYIPYNGPIEPPRNEDTNKRGRKRTSSNAKSYVSSQGTRSFYGGSGIGDAPVNSAAFMQRDSTFGTRERASTYDRGSIYSKDGDGEREKTREREHRGSIASFLTFGHSIRRRTVVDTDPPGFVFPKIQGQGRRSEDSHLHGWRSEESRGHAPARRSDESAYSSRALHSSPHHPHTPFQQHPQSFQRGRSAALSLTAADRERDSGREWNARDSMEVSGAPPPRSASPGFSQQQHYTYGELRDEWNEEEEEADEEPSEIQWDNRVLRQNTLAHSTSHPVLPRAPMPHPYAVVFPSVMQDPQPIRDLRPLAVPSHAPTNLRSATSSKPSSFKPKQQHPRRPATAGVVSPAAIAAALNNNTRGILRPRSLTSSTPNLRARLSRDKDKTFVKEKDKVARVPSSNVGSEIKAKTKTHYTAETWCDALMFPRPRFRAHVVSPPESPEDDKRAQFPVLRRTVSAKTPPRTDYSPGPPAPPSPQRDQEREYLLPEPSRTSQQQQQFSRPLNRSQTQLVSTPSPPKFYAPHPPATAPPLTPTEETLRKVVVEGELRDKEREAWNEVARTSFQNRRSRSLSRTRSRKKSAPTARLRVESDATPTSGARSLAMELAAQAFRQPTPTISVSVSGTSGGRTSESNPHSRNPSSSAQHGSGLGHTRNTSWGKVALGRLCGPDDPETSPEEKLEGALMTEKTARMSVRGRREEAAEADVQFMDIAPLPTRTLLEAEPPVLDRSRSQSSYVSDSLDVPGVGIAISTPPHPSPVEDLPDLSAHPYAQSSSSPHRRAQPVPVSAPYAGPHPTSFDYARTPREQQLQQTQQQVEIKQSPVAWEHYKGAGSPSAYAYANVSANDKRESTLGVEEALLSHSFQRGGDVQFGDMNEYEAMPAPPREHTPPPVPVPPTSTTTHAESRAHRRLVALNAHSGIPSLSHTVTSAAHTDLPDGEQVRNVVRESQTAMSSPISQGTMSGQTSPRVVDDLEPFRDLFYQPGRSGSFSQENTPSSELRRVLEARREESPRPWSEDRIKSDEGLGGLRALARRRPSYESSMITQEFAEDLDGRRGAYSSQLDGVQEVQLGPSASPLPGLNSGSLQLGTPLRAEYEEGQNFPEDIESSRASSIMQPESHEDLEETLRLGTVPLAVPETTENEHRQSTALSFGDTEDGGSLRPNRDTMVTTTSSLGIPGTVEDLVRTSFVTSTSTTSRMSNLIGDFPIPPWAEGVMPPSAAALDAYFVPSGDSRVQSQITDDSTPE